MCRIGWLGAYFAQFSLVDAFGHDGFGGEYSGTVWADDLQLLVDGKPIAQAPGKPVQPSSMPVELYDGSPKVRLPRLVLYRSKAL
jgi:hypothetical protein